MTPVRQVGTLIIQRWSLGRVAGVRRLIFVALVLSIALLIPATLTSSESSMPPAIRVVTVGLMFLACWRWSAWVRGRRWHYLDLGIEALALVLAAIAIGDPVVIAPVVFTTLWYRPLVTSSRFAAAGAFVSCGIFVTTTYSIHPQFDATTVGPLVGLIPLVAMTATLGQVLAYTFEKQKQLTDKVSAAEQRYRSLVEQLPEVVFTRSMDGVFSYVSPQVGRILGWEADDLVGMTLEEYTSHIHPADRKPFQEHRNDAAHETEPFLIEYRFRGQSGTYRWVRAQGRVIVGPDGEHSQWLGTISDINERKRLEDRLAFQAFHDSLTGLPNRALLRDRLDHALARGERTGASLALLFLDLDNFKIVNDSLGHQAGDKLIQDVAERVQSVVRGADTVARIGGDEFLILLEDIQDEAAPVEVAKRILAALSSALSLKGQTLSVSGSIGVVLSTARETNTDEMIRNADLAMYAAKQRGRSGYALYTPEMGNEAVKRLEIESGLRLALERDEFVVHFQPVVDLRTGSISEVEGLIRWNHPERGLVYPDQFLDVAEETGLIRKIDLWVLRESCQQVRTWQLSCPHHANLIASVNLSPSQLREEKLCEQVSSILKETGLRPQHLKLEITEHAMVADIKRAHQALLQLSSLGVKLAIDDFGTGNTALNYLREFPVDTLKIDRSFVTGLRRGSGDADMVEALVTFAGALGLNVTAEGIEGDEHEELLRFGCDHGQGYHFARPQEASVLEYIIRQPTINMETYTDISEAAAG